MGTIYIEMIILEVSSALKEINTNHYAVVSGDLDRLQTYE